MGDSFFYTAIPSFTKLLLLCFIREKLNIKTNDSLSWNLNGPISEFVGETSYLVLTFLSPNVFFHELTIRYDMLCDPIIPWATITEYWISISYLRSVNWLWKKWKKDVISSLRQPPGNIVSFFCISFLQHVSVTKCHIIFFSKILIKLSSIQFVTISFMSNFIAWGADNFVW